MDGICVCAVLGIHDEPFIILSKFKGSVSFLYKQMYIQSWWYLWRYKYIKISFCDKVMVKQK